MTALQPPSVTPWMVMIVVLSAVLALLVLGLSLNESGFYLLNHWGQHWPVRLWAGITLLGDSTVHVIIVAIIAFYRPRILWPALLFALLGTVVSGGLKELFDQMRPPAVLDVSTFQIIGRPLQRGSLPSGHTVSTFGLLIVLLTCVPQVWGRGLLCLLAAVIGISRIMVGVHWPLDVAVGAALGSAVAWLCLKLAQYSAERLPRYTESVLYALFVAVGVSAWGFDGHFDGMHGLANSLICVLVVMALKRVSDWVRSGCQAKDASNGA